MNKAELVSAVAEKAGLTKAQAAAALDQGLGGIALQSESAGRSGY